MAGRTVGKTELAAITGHSIKTITRWQEEGMPYTPGKTPTAPLKFNTAHVIKWMITREAHGGLDLDAERAKLAREQAKMAEMKNLERSGDLISVEAATVVAQKAANAIRQKIVNSSLTEHEKQKLLVEINALGSVTFEDAERAAEKEDDDAATEDSK